MKNSVHRSFSISTEGSLRVYRSEVTDYTGQRSLDMVFYSSGKLECTRRKDIPLTTCLREYIKFLTVVLNNINYEKK